MLIDGHVATGILPDMHTDEVNSSAEIHAYDNWIQGHPEGSLWQSTAWKRYQEALGRTVRIFVVMETPSQGVSTILASALVIIDRTVGGFSSWEIPRGPLWIGKPGHQVEKLFELLHARATKDKCMAIYLSPTRELQDESYKLQVSKRHQMPEATRMIDLTASEKDILKQMKPKGRYNIAVAWKHGVTVEKSKDIDAFYELILETSQRDGFSPPAKKHFEAFLYALHGSFFLLAQDTAKKPIAGLLGVIFGKQSIYYYGASSYTSRALMAPYLLQWEAMKHCKAQGCEWYDLFGIAPERHPPVGRAGKTQDIRHKHPWAGVSAFKEKFGGKVVEYPAEQMMLLRQMPYYALRLKRKILG